MTGKLLKLIEEQYPLVPVPVGEFEQMKVSGMKFRIQAFQAVGLGNISVMTAVGFFGLMKMDTMIIIPTQKDMPLLSYDRVLAMGNDTLIYELYDTLLEHVSFPLLDGVKEQIASLPDHDLGSHWYDSIKLSASFAKKGKKGNTQEFNDAAKKYLAAYLSSAQTAAECLAGPKREKAAVYVDGLLTHGGPSTDVFKRGIGEEKTSRLFREVLFATQI